MPGQLGATPPSLCSLSCPSISFSPCIPTRMVPLCLTRLRCAQRPLGLNSHPRLGWVLLFPGSEPKQHRLFPAGQSDEGATEGRAAGESLQEMGAEEEG